MEHLAIENLTAKEEFDALSRRITANPKRYLELKLESEFLKQLSQNYFRATINQGVMPDISHIYLYFLYKEKNGDFADTANTIQALKNALENGGASEAEKMMILQAIFICEIISFRAQEGYLFFFREISKLHIHECEGVGGFDVLLEFLNDTEFDFDSMLEIGKENLALQNYRTFTATQRRSIPNWMLHFFWHAKKIHNTRRWLELYPSFKNALYFLIEQNEIENVMHLQFIIYHFMGNSYQTQSEWRIFNTEISTPCALYYKQKGVELALPKANNEIHRSKKSGKIRIGILKDRFVENSVYKVEYSFLKNLYADVSFREQYEIVIYLMNYIEKSLSSEKIMLEYIKLGIPIIDCTDKIIQKGYYHSHFEKALAIREALRNDEIAILLSPNNGYDISDFILSTRTAPLQIFWSHGNFVYDIGGIDKRITHINISEAEGFAYDNFHIEIAENLKDTIIQKETIESERSKYPKDAFILGTIGRLVKVDNEAYLGCIAEILRKNPNAIYIAAGSGSIDSIKKKLSPLGLEDRFYFPGYVDARIYGEIIDLWCNTFPLTQGESFNEFLELGKPFISMVEDPEEGWIEKYKNSARRFLYPYKQEDYIAYATELIKNPSLAKEALEIFWNGLEKKKSDVQRFVDILDV